MDTKQIVGILDGLNADPDLSRGCRHVCGLAANIVLVCDQRGETIEALTKERDEALAKVATLEGELEGFRTKLGEQLAF